VNEQAGGALQAPGLEEFAGDAMAQPDGGDDLQHAGDDRPRRDEVEQRDGGQAGEQQRDDAPRCGRWMRLAAVGCSSRTSDA
jgi:hypothetical protein